MVQSIELRVHSYARLYAHRVKYHALERYGLTQLGIRSVDANPHNKTEEFVYTALGKAWYGCTLFYLCVGKLYVNINSLQGE